LDDPEELESEVAARVFEAEPFAGDAEGLTGWSSKDDVDLSSEGSPVELSDVMVVGCPWMKLPEDRACSRLHLGECDWHGVDPSVGEGHRRGFNSAEQGDITDRTVEVGERAHRDGSPAAKVDKMCRLAMWAVGWQRSPGEPFVVVIAVADWICDGDDGHVVVDPVAGGFEECDRDALVVFLAVAAAVPSAQELLLPRGLSPARFR
jgi:hypothetical protein